MASYAESYNSLQKKLREASGKQLQTASARRTQTSGSSASKTSGSSGTSGASVKRNAQTSAQRYISPYAEQRDKDVEGMVEGITTGFRDLGSALASNVRTSAAALRKAAGLHEKDEDDKGIINEAIYGRDTGNRAPANAFTYRDDPEAQKVIEETRTRQLAPESDYNPTDLLASYNLNDDQQNEFWYRYARDGRRAAVDYLEGLNPDQWAQERELMEAQAEELAKENPVAGAAVAIAAPVVTAPVQAVGAAGNFIEGALMGRDIDPNDPSLRSSHVNDALVRGLSEAAQEATGFEEGSFAANALDFGIQTGLSIGQSASRLAAGGGFGSLLMAGLNAATSGMADAADRGASGRQAALSGLSAGIAEGFFERYSIDGLLKTGPADSVKGFFENMAAQAATEGYEELATEMTNTVTDGLIMQENSHFEEYRRAHLAEGDSELESYRGAILDVASNLLTAFLGGAVSGGIMGGAATGRQMALKRRFGRTSAFQTADDFAELAESIDTDAESYTDRSGSVNTEALQKAEEVRDMASSLAMRADAGETIGDIEKGDLAFRVYDLVNTASDTARDASRGAETIDVQLVPVDMTDEASFARTEAEAMTQWANILKRPDFQSLSAMTDQGRYTVRKIDGRYYFDSTADVQEGFQVPSAIEATDADIGAGTEADITQYLPLQDMNAPRISARVTYGPQTGTQTQQGDRRATGSTAQEAHGAQDTASQSLDGEISAEYAQGLTEGPVASQEARYEGQTAGMIDAQDTGLSESAKETMVQTYDGSVPAARYMEAFRRYYAVGREDLSMSSAENSPYAVYLTTEQKQAAFREGALERNRIMAANREASERAESSEKEARTPREGGLTYASREATEAQRTVAEHIGKRTGLKIEITSLRDGSAEYDPQNGTIRIDPASENFNESLAHELTHFIQDYDQDSYMRFRQLAVEALMESRQTNFEDLYDQYEQPYMEAYGGVDYDTVIDEMTADAAGMFLNDEDFIQRVTTEDRSLAEKIRDFFRDIADALRELINTNVRRASRALKEQEARYRTAQGLWTKALDRAGERNRAGEARSVTGLEVKNQLDVSEPVEETGNLIAVHNLTADKLSDLLELDGIPMPSIAVTRADLGHTNFGDISLVFRKDTIDPANSLNRVYSADAWTPMFPRIDYELDSAAAERVETDLAELMDAHDELYDYYKEQIRRFIQSLNGGAEYRGQEGVIERALQNSGMRALYLAESGSDVTPQTSTERTPVSEGWRNVYSNMANAIDGDFDSVSDSEKLPLLREAYLDARKHSALAQRRAESFTAEDARRYFDKARSYVRDGIDYTENESTDYESPLSDIDEEDFGAWIRDMMDGLDASAGVYNGRDPFTSSGRRRTFRELHYDVNAENIVKAMLQQGEKDTSTFFAGVQSLRAAGSRTFESLDDIRKNSGRLQEIDTEAYESYLDGLSNRLNTVISDITPDNAQNVFIEMDRVGSAIAEAAGDPTVSNIRNTLEGYGFSVSDSQVQEIKDIIDGVTNMPVRIFEAKPQRVVGYDEIAAAVVPDDIDAALEDELRDRGIRVLKYPEGNEEVRKDIVASIPNVRFQLRSEDGRRFNELGYKAFTEHERDRWSNNPKIIICNTVQDLQDYIDLMKETSFKTNYEAYLGIVSNEFADRLLRDTGLDTHGYTLKINKQSFEHALSHHGGDKEAPRGQVRIVPETFLRVPNAVLNYDNAVRSDYKDNMGFRLFGNNLTVTGVVANSIQIRVEDLWERASKKEGRPPTTTSTSSDVTASYVRNALAQGLSYGQNIPQSGDGVKLRRQLRIDEESRVDPERLAVANENLRTSAQLLSEALSNATYMPTDEQIERTVRKLKRDTKSLVSDEELTSRLKTLYNYVQHNDNIDGEEMASIAADIADGLLSNSRLEYDPEETRLYREYLDRIRGYTYEIGDDLIDEVSYKYGSMRELRSKYFGRLNIRKGAQSNIDQIYQELSEMYPGDFPDDVANPADQLSYILDGLDAMRPHAKNPTDSMTAEDYRGYTYEIGSKIFEDYFSPQTKEEFSTALSAYRKSARAQYDRQLRQVNKRYQDMIQKLASQYKDLQDTEAKTRNREQQAALRDQSRREAEAMRAFRRAANDEARYYYNERYNRNQDERMVVKDISDLSNWLLKPTDKKHVPEYLRKTVADFLSKIDIAENRVNFKGDPTAAAATFADLKAAYDKIRLGEESLGSQYMDVDDDISYKIEMIMSDLSSGKKLYELDAAGMRRLKEIVRSMKKTIMDADKLISNAQYERVADIGKNTIADLAGYKKATDRVLGAKVSSFFQNDLLDSQTRFHTFGPAAESVYRELREGFNTKIRSTQEAADYMEDLMKRTGTSTRDIQAWGGDRAPLITYTTVGGSTISLKPSQIMSLYELNKRRQAQKHIYSEGVNTAPLKFYDGRALPINEKTMHWDHPVKLTPTDVKALTDMLTPQQKAVADGITAFFKNTSKWGNEASVDLYGYEKFNAPDYFPIRSDRNTVRVDENKVTGNIDAIKNMGMTKPTLQRVTNPLILDDIFSVFTDQVDKMGSYRAFLVPLSDLNKWINYRDPQDLKYGVRQSLERAYGKNAMEYINRLIADINGVTRADSSGSLFDSAVSNFKGAAMGMNLRTAIQQPTAYLRAAVEIDPKYLTKALTMKDDLTKDQIEKYSPIFQWKDWGFYETHIGRSLRSILMGPASGFERFRDTQMVLNALGDEVAWRNLWKAVELETADRYPGLQRGTDAFYKRVNSRFEEIIDRTQVVDSVFSRSQLMRSKDKWNKMVTSFMSEPSKNYNMLYRAAFDLATADTKAGKTKATKKLVRSVLGYVASGAGAAAAASIVSAMRDDDKEKEWGEKYLTALGDALSDNLNPLGMIPWIRDILSIMDGYDVARTDMSLVQEAWWTFSDIGQKIAGSEEKSWPALINATAQRLAAFAGVGFENAQRDLYAVVNTVLNIPGFGDTGFAQGAEYGITRLRQDIGSTKNVKDYVRLALDAYAADNKELGDSIVQDMLDHGIEDEKVQAKLKDYLKEEESFTELVTYRYEGDTGAYNRIKQELMSDGYPEEMIDNAAKNAMDDMGPSYADITSEVSSFIAGSSTSYKDLNASISELAKKLRNKNGWDAKKIRSTIRSQLTKEFKPLYQEASGSERQRIKSVLTQLKADGEKIYDDEDVIDDWLDE